MILLALFADYELCVFGILFILSAQIQRGLFAGNSADHGLAPPRAVSLLEADRGGCSHGRARQHGIAPSRDGGVRRAGERAEPRRPGGVQWQTARTAAAGAAGPCEEGLGMIVQNHRIHSKVFFVVISLIFYGL